MRTGIALLGAAAIALALAGCAGSGTTVPGFQGPDAVTAPPSPSPSETPISTPVETPIALPSVTGTPAVTMDCANAPVTLNVSATTYTLTGICPTVLVEGQGIVVNGPDVASLEVRGTGDTFSLGTVTTLTISGQSNVVGAQAIGTVTINGDSNKLTSASTVGGGVFNGNTNEVHAPGAIGTFTGGTANTTGQ